MKVAVMQPYLFPYIGYWQLINAVDKFVILDDVNYIKKGFINRNRFLINGAEHIFTVPLEKASQNKRIMDMKLNFPAEERKKLVQSIEYAYKKAPFFNEVMPILEKIICFKEDRLTEYICNSIREISDYLGIGTALYRSSEIDKDTGLKGQERILSLCQKLEADTYINPSGGRALYNHRDFTDRGINLCFLDVKSENISYIQYNRSEFVPMLSVIDVLMFNDTTQIERFLQEYELND